MRRVALLSLACSMLAACSAYQRTYDEKLAALEQQAKAEDAQQAAMHREASRYAAVIYFATGSAAVDEDGIRQLAWFADKMKPYPQAVILVQGFTDNVGSEASNQQLSEQRAQAVGQILQADGFTAARLDVQGFGTNYAAAPNATSQGRRNNRRVEVTVR